MHVVQCLSLQRAPRTVTCARAVDPANVTTASAFRDMASTVLLTRAEVGLFKSSQFSFLKRGRKLLDVFYHLILRSYDYNMHGEDLLATHLCLGTLLNQEKCSQFERFYLHHALMIKQSQFKNKIDWHYCRGEQRYLQFPLVFNFPSFWTADFPLQIAAWPILAPFI